MDCSWLEGVANGVHREERSESGLVTKVILELTAGELRAGRRLGCNEAGLLSFLDLVTHEWEGDATEVATSTEAGNHDVWILACHFHLLLCFEADNSLVE